MKERPILFSAPMVRALLDGTKTQTRRVVKGLTDKTWIEAAAAGGFAVCYDSEPTCGNGVWEVTEHSHPIACPHGQPGDRLWVREAFRLTTPFEKDSPAKVGDLSIDAGYSKPWAPIQYEADGKRDNWLSVSTVPAPVEPGRLRPGIHMPRWASRIDVEITGVRVERLQDISEADAVAEGCAPARPNDDDARHMYTARWAYEILWEQINGSGSWATNPWVWVVEFRRLRA